MVRSLKVAFGIEVSFSYGDNPCVHIGHSHLVESESAMKAVLNHIHRMPEYEKLLREGWSRSYDSELREWKAHNRLYKMGLFKSHTESVDIDQKESIWRRIVYWILTIF